MHEQAEIHPSFFTEVRPKTITANSEKCECYCSDQSQKSSGCKSKQYQNIIIFAAVCGLGFSLLIEFPHNKMISYTYLWCSQVCGCSSNQV